MSLLPRVAAIPVAAAAGLALLLAFPPHGIWWLAPMAVALLAIAVRGRRFWGGAGLGMLSGLVFFIPLLAWTALNISTPPWLLLSILESAYLGLLGGIAAFVTTLLDRYPATWPALTAVLWVGQEALRDRTPFGGFPWARLAFSQADSPLLRLAVVGGAPFVTFAVALAGGLLAAALWRLPALIRRPDTGPEPKQADPKRTQPRTAALTVAATVAGAVAVLLAGLAVPAPAPDGPPVRVAIVQGNVPRLGLDFNAQRRAVLDNHVNETIELAGRVAAGEQPRPDLVVWPENASDIDPLRNADAAARIDQAARAIGVPILVGAVLIGPGPGRVSNVSIVWSPDGGAGRQYLKRHPVPFAEYMPWRSVIAPIAGFVADEANLLSNDFVAGKAPGVLRVGPATVGAVICFEVADDGIVRDTVTNGARLLAVQTNNATFDESEAVQQLAMVRLRAVEHGRDALMASTVGVSGFVTAGGVVHDATGFNTPAVVVHDLRLGDGRTLATRLGVWPEAVLTLLALAAVVGAVWLRRRTRPGR